MASKPLIVTYDPSYVPADISAQVTIKGQGFLELLADSKVNHVLSWSYSAINDTPIGTYAGKDLVVVDNYTIITVAEMHTENWYVGRIGYYNKVENTWENLFVNESKPLP